MKQRPPTQSWDAAAEGCCRCDGIQPPSVTGRGDRSYSAHHSRPFHSVPRGYNLLQKHRQRQKQQWKRNNKRPTLEAARGGQGKGLVQCSGEGEGNSLDVAPRTPADQLGPQAVLGRHRECALLSRCGPPASLAAAPGGGNASLDSKEAKLSPKTGPSAGGGARPSPGNFIYLELHPPIGFLMNFCYYFPGVGKSRPVTVTSWFLFFLFLNIWRPPLVRTSLLWPTCAPGVCTAEAPRCRYRGGSSSPSGFLLGYESAVAERIMFRISVS